MLNKDMPAMPLDSQAESDCAVGYTYDFSGLSKREHFAAMAMQGLLSNPNIVNAGGTNTVDRVQNMAVSYADNVLAALEKNT